MGNLGNRLSLLVIFSALLSSCMGGEALMMLMSKTKKKTSIDLHVSDYSKASCEFTADQGDQAVLYVPAVDLKETYFGKKYDHNLLKAVLTASAAETVRFAKMTNVDFYTVSRYKKDSCLMASFIPEAQVFYQAQFATVGQGVLGVYLPPKHVLVEKTNETPTIMVRQDVSRWVLVHEFMHHLFSKEIQNIISDETLGIDLQAAEDKLKTSKEKYKISKSAEDGKAMLDAAKIVVTLAPEQLKRFSLEEMAIEIILLEQLNSNAFRNVPFNQSINGAAYIYTSASRAETKLIALSLDAMFAGTDTLLMQEKLTEEEYKNYRDAFKSAEKQIDSYRTELKALKKRAEEKLRQEGLNPKTDVNGFLDIYGAATDQGKADHRHVGCSHSQR